MIRKREVPIVLEDDTKISSGSVISSLTNSPYILGLIVFLAGAILPLAFAPFSIFMLAIVSPLVFFTVCYYVTAAQAKWYGFVFGLGFFGVGISWVYVAMHDFGSTPVPLAILLTFVCAAFLALFPAMQAYLSARYIHAIEDEKLKRQLVWWVFPLMWLLFEWIRGWILTGFPWLNLGYSQIDSPLAGYAPVLGVYGISFLIVISSGLLLRILIARCVAVKWLSFISLLVVWSLGYGLKFIEWTEPTGEPIRVATVQGNLLQKDKWSRNESNIRGRLQHYSSLSEPLWGNVDLIVWPENALTTIWQTTSLDYRASLEQRANESNTDLIVGTPYINIETGRYYSSLVVVGKNPGVYSKRHLVPFGEYVPLQSILRGLIRFFDLPMSDFSSGDDEQQVLQAANQKLAPSICYEDAFGEEMLNFLPEATLLVNGTNNAWYGEEEDALLPHQHLQISRMRALEMGRDMIRATTTGISAMINYKGQLIATSPNSTEHVLRDKVQPREGSTPYVIWGNWPIIALLLFGLFVAYKIRLRYLTRLSRV